MAFSIYAPVAPGLLFPEPSVINNYSTKETSASASANARAVKQMTRGGETFRRPVPGRGHRR